MALFSSQRILHLIKYQSYHIDFHFIKKIELTIDKISSNPTKKNDRDKKIPPKFLLGNLSQKPKIGIDDRDPFNGNPINGHDINWYRQLVIIV